MMNLTSKDRATLAKLLALAGSTTHDGETLTAMRKADALVKAAGATWPDVVLAKPVHIVPQPRSTPAEREHVTIARNALQRGRGILTSWERRFLTSILGYRGLKPRQLETLSLISKKVALATADAA